MVHPRILLVTVLCALILALPPSLRAQDEITVAAESPCLMVAGSPIFVPVYVRDVSGTPLGLDEPPGKRIQGLSFKVTYSPASAVSSIFVKRSGVLAQSVAISEFAIANANTVSYLGLFDEEFNPIRFHLDAPVPGDLVAYLVVTVSAGAAAGSRIDFVLGGAETTSLTDQGGVISETESNGNLRTQSGCVQLVERRRRAVRK